MPNLSYSQGLLEGHRHLLRTYPEVFVFGQGLWSPWYVGASMTDLDRDFGRDRIIDSPVSEVGVTGAALGAALGGYRPLVVHPRMDFMILAVDQIVSQSAKWSHMFGAQMSAPITIRSIINRGGEQGAQHSQALHSWFAHIPGLRVVMPARPSDARDLLIASVLSDDPVMFIDDRWLYEVEEDAPAVTELKLEDVKPRLLRSGDACTLVAAGYSVELCLRAADELQAQGISTEVIDLRVVNPIDYGVIVSSVRRTGRLCAVDGGWANCGLAGEIVAGVMERVDLSELKASPKRITLTNSPAPASSALESNYYTTKEDIISQVSEMVLVSAEK